MEEFKKDLIAVFNKHCMTIVKGSVEIDCSPINVNPSQNFSYRDIIVKFRQVMRDKEEIKQLAEKYGISVVF